MEMTTAEFKDLSVKEFKVYQEFLLKEFGIRLADSKIALVRGRLGARIRKLGLGSFSEYFEFAMNRINTEERSIMIDKLTTHETRFFREPGHFNWLADHVSVNSAADRKFRVWSAASSTGEEAFSAAMILADRIGMHRWEILGTDVSPGSVENATRAVYDTRREANISEDFLKKYCLRGVGQMEGFFTIRPDLQKQVQFKPMNLMAIERNIGLFDVVFLNNVLIYFDQSARKSTVKAILDHIRPGGHLIVGSSESLNGITEDLQWVRQSIYQKRM
jgi:chemotaxis protein methyltransferase CheR